MKSRTIRNITAGVVNSAAGAKNCLLRACTGLLKPRWVALQVTDRCNSRCLHCNIWKTPNVRNPLSAGEIEAAFADDLFRDTVYVQVSGGEPTVREDLGEILLGIHRSLPRATLQLSTNGLRPGRVLEVVRSALDVGIRLFVGVSLDGIGGAHDRIRGVKGNFEKVDFLLNELTGIRDRSGGLLHVSAGIVVSDLTLASLAPVRQYARRLGLELTEAWYNECLFYGNQGEERAASPALVSAIRSQPPSPLKELWLRKLAGESHRFPCFAMYRFCILKYDGDIVPCLNHFDMSAGNVRSRTPTEIWHSRQMKRVRRNVRRCAGCLNSWGAGWSMRSSYYQYLTFYLKHPRLLRRDLEA